MASPDRISNENLAAIAREMMRIKAQHFGKGPEESKAFQVDDTLLCVMRGGFTQVERTLLEGGEDHLVRQVRLRFQEQMADTFRDAVERISGRRVIAFTSQVTFDPDYAFEIAVLGDPLPDTS